MTRFSRCRSLASDKLTHGAGKPAWGWPLWWDPHGRSTALPEAEPAPAGRPQRGRGVHAKPDALRTAGEGPTRCRNQETPDEAERRGSKTSSPRRRAGAGRGTSHAYTCPVLLPASAAAGPRAPGRIYLLVANVHLKNISSCTPEAPVTSILLSIIMHLASEALANASVVIILKYMNTASHHVHFKLTQGYMSNTRQQKIIHF